MNAFVKTFGLIIVAFQISMQILETKIHLKLFCFTKFIKRLKNNLIFFNCNRCWFKAVYLFTSFSVNCYFMLRNNIYVSFTIIIRSE